MLNLQGEIFILIDIFFILITFFSLIKISWEYPLEILNLTLASSLVGTFFYTGWLKFYSINSIINFITDLKKFIFLANGEWSLESIKTYWIGSDEKFSVY